MPGSGRHKAARLQPVGLYVLMVALLLGVLWSGGYFPVPKGILTSLILAAAVWELAVAVVLGEKVILRSPAFWIFAVFFLAAVSSSFRSPSSAQNLEVMMLLGYLAVLFVGRSQLIRSRGRAGIVLVNWMIYAAAFAAVWGIITYLLQVYPYASLVDGFMRAGSTFEYSNALSCFQLMALPLTLALHQQGKPDARPLFATVASLETAAVALTFSRLGLVMLAAILIFFLTTSWRRQALPETAVLIVMGIIMGGASLVLSEAEQGIAGVAVLAVLAGASYFVHYAMSSPDRRWPAKAIILLTAAGGTSVALLVAASGRARTIVTSRFGEGFSINKLLPHRQDTWAAAYNAFQDRPLRGWGLGNFADVFLRYQTARFTKYAHNVLLQVAVDTGIIGALPFAAFLGYAVVLSCWHLAIRFDLKTRALAIAILVFLLYNMVDWEWYVPAITAWFMVLLACLEGPFKKSTGDKRLG